MAYVPKTGVQTFDSEWQKAAAWAQTQGIGEPAIAAVYQMDLKRSQNGEYPMGVAERNLSLIAAHDPKQVTSAPSDQPSSPFTPTGAFHNTVSDAGKIATGIAGIFTGSFEKQVYDSAKATVKGVIDPASLESKKGGAAGVGGTIGNWLNDTLLAYLPGAADIGTVLQHDPTLTGSSGFEALAQHPLVSILDVLPGEGGLAGKVAGKLGATEIAARLAARGGDKSAVASIVDRLGSSTKGGKPGATIGGGLKSALSVKDRVENMMAKVPGGGVGPAISAVQEAGSTAEMMSVDKYQWLLDTPTVEWNALSDSDKALVQKIKDTTRTTGGDSYRQAMEDHSVSPAVKAVLQSWTNGPERFATESGLASGQLGVSYSLSGERGMWAFASDKFQHLMGLNVRRQVAHRAAAATLDELEPHAERLEKLDTIRQRAQDGLEQAITAARQTVLNDPKLQTEELTRELPRKVMGRERATLSKKEQLHSVVGEGGLMDRLKDLNKTGDPDRILPVAEIAVLRTSAWGADSVDAADHPALAALHRQAQGMVNWAKAMQREQKAIEDAIHGEESKQAHFLNDQVRYRAQRIQVLKDRQVRERDELLSGYQLGKRVRTAKLGQKISDANERRLWYIESVRSEGDAEARRATQGVLESQIMPKVRQRERDFNHATAKQIKDATRKLQAEKKLAYTEFERDRSRMSRRHATEMRRESREARIVEKGMGQMLADVVRLGDTVREYHDAVADTPADQYKDVIKALYHKHLMAAEDTTALNIAADRYLRNVPGMTKTQLDKLRSNPQVIAELIDMHFNEIMHQPDLDPEIAQAARAENDKYKEDAKETFKRMHAVKHKDPAKDFRIQYVPVATTRDEWLGRNSMSPLIGHGIPKPDLAKAKVGDLTPDIHDFAVAVNKAVVQELHRQATIELAEHNLTPMASTQQQVLEHMLAYTDIVKRVGKENTPQRLADIAADQLGLKAFDPKALWGFTLPRWSKAQKMYLPSPIVDALTRIEKDRQKSILARGNRLFRYSILGLSPRYTAHIIFGGGMMLALRSTPYMPSMILKASRALRDGTVPREVLRGRESELGFQEAPRTVLDEWHKEAGKDAINGLAVPEHIETRQKIKMAAAKPVHVLKALADINLRFTEHVRHMQATVAYFDGVAKADRKFGKVEVEDPMTGKMVTVSSERAIKEGIHHVQQVYGNLNRMSPVEKQIAQTFMPFYGWQKHILGYVMSFPFDHPYRALILSQLAYNSSNDIPAAWPIRLQLLHFLGAPDKNGNVDVVDLRSLDPFRDVANYASLTGVFEALNPAITALPSVVNPEFSYGSSQLYPGVTYNAFYGINTSTNGGSWLNAIEQFVPQVSAVQSAAQAAGGYRSEWQTNKSSAIKSLLSSLNVPFVTPPINLKQIAAKDEAARFESAKSAAQDAFSSGDFRGLAGYKTVPNPLNTAYEVTPTQLEALYHQAQQANPGVAPIEALLPPPTPSGW